MKKQYEKPYALYIDMRFTEAVMYVGEYSEGAGEGDGFPDYDD